MFAFDLDGTLSDTLGAVRLELARAGFTLAGDVTDYSTHAGIVHDDDLERASEMISALYHRGSTYRLAPMMPGANEGVGWLHSKKLARCYITRRPVRFRDETVAWLDEHSFPRLPLEFTERAGDKVRAMARHGAKVLVDDDARETDAALNAGLGAVLVDHPYNRESRTAGLMRLHGWGGIHRVFSTLPIDHRAKREKGF